MNWDIIPQESTAAQRQALYKFLGSSSRRFVHQLNRNQASRLLKACIELAQENKENEWVKEQK